MSTPPKKRDPRMGLRTSATLATVFVILGQTFFGFEQSVAQVFVCLAAGYASALFFEWVDAKANGDVPGYAGGGFKKLADWLLSAHMTSITLSFLLYYNRQLWIAACAVVLAIGSKYLFRVTVNGRLQHFMNPSNFGIVVVLSVFKWVGVLPWGWTINLHGAWDVIVPLIILGLGFRLNLLFTGRLPLIGAWLGTFILQAAFRSWRMDTPLVGQLVVLTGITMVLFTLYMITDPQTSPSRPRSQVIFGAGIAIAYSILFDFHLQYTMFYAVTAVCAIRGVVLYVAGKRQPAPQPAVFAAAAAAGSMSQAAPVGR
ncbi:MAG: enediyne biosynthesis protein UnbU [Bryobacteraceae bacterium]